jgi:hypothetical protein
MSIGVVVLLLLFVRANSFEKKILSKTRLLEMSACTTTRNTPHFETVFSHLFCIYTNYSLSLSLFIISSLNNK